MTSHPVANKKSQRSNLLLTVSLGTLMLGAGSAEAQDMLARRGGDPSAQAARAAQGQAERSAAAQAAIQRSRDAFARAAATRDAMRQAQDAARAAALAVQTNVPNGLTNVDLTTQIGGLQIAQGVDWQGANAPVQTSGPGDRTVVTIEQTEQRAILAWDSFNIGRETDLAFNQGGADWVALNRVTDVTTNPSQILGRIDAQGSVYIINRNGIIFGGASQVNVRGLVASALPIHDPLFQNDIFYSNPDRKFSFSAYSESQGLSTGAFTAPTATEQSRNSRVEVQQGARISATNDSAGGGRIVLIGPNVDNAGVITANDGQVILAAGQQVALLPHSSEDPSLRGLDVYIGAVKAPVVNVEGPEVGSAESDLVTGQATNSGLIETARGAITMAGAGVNQMGVLHATTSVTLNGRIDLLAEYNTTAMERKEGVGNAATTFQVFNRGGTGLVQLGPDSLSEILPEFESSQRVAGSSLALDSTVNLTGQTIYLDRNATILAPSGNVTAKAGRYMLLGSGTSAEEFFSFDSGQIYLDVGASVQVSGAIVAGNAADNIVAVELRGSELADSPLQRNGVLHGETVYVDITRTGLREDGSVWVGTPLADVSGYVGLVQRTVGELSTDAGSVTLNAGGSVVLQDGSWLDVSNGWIDYAGSVGQTTTLLGADGRVYDIANATPDRLYVGFAGDYVRDHSRWGVTEVWRSWFADRRISSASYLHGGAGGAVRLRAPTMAFAGDVFGGVVAGERQRENAPDLSSLEVDLLGLVSSSSPRQGFIAPLNTQDIVIQENSPSAFIAEFSASNDALDPVTPILLSSVLLSETGVGRLAINSANGDISVSSAITGPARGELDLTGRNVTFAADVTLAGGAVSATAMVFPPRYGTPEYDFMAQPGSPGLSTPEMTQGRGYVRVAEGVSVSTAGLLADDLNDSELQPWALNGGSISLTGYRTELAEGSVLDVSGGMAVSVSGGLRGGGGGTILLNAEGGVGVNPAWGLGRLTLDGELRGYGVHANGTTARGGSLRVVAPAVNGEIGGHAVLIGGDTAPADLNALWLQSDFFDQGGFASFSISSSGTQEVVAGTIIDPTINAYVLAQDGSSFALERATLDPLMRSPFSLNLTSQDVLVNGMVFVRGDTILGADAEVHARPTLGGAGRVALIGGSATVLGSVYAAGGTIDIASNASNSSRPMEILVDIGADSVLSAAGAVISTYNPFGRDTGYVLKGGTINVSGRFIIEEGALLDVSGATALLDTPIYNASLERNAGYEARQIDGDAGAITLSNAWLSLGTLKGDAGGRGRGGVLTISSSALTEGDPALHQGVNLTVVQSFDDVTLNLGASGEMAGGGLLTDWSWGQFAADDFMEGGFDTLELKGGVQFSGPVSITAPGGILIGDNSLWMNGGLIAADADSDVTLNASYVRLGRNLSTTLGASSHLTGAMGPGVRSSYGANTLTVNATELIDLGAAALQGIGTVNLNVVNDLRGYGTFEATGDINIAAGLVYPVSGAAFTLTARNPGTQSNPTGSITFQSTGIERSLPLSAGGVINVYADTITQGGVLRAPFGQINLGSTAVSLPGNNLGSGDPSGSYAIARTTQLVLAGGGVTSVSGVDPITGQGVTVPYGVMLDEHTWLDPLGNDISLSGPPQKRIDLVGSEVRVEQDALIDLSGGGDLVAYDWVPGLGGSRDVLASSDRFAVLPSYGAGYAPLAAVSENLRDPSGGGLTWQAGWNEGGFAVGEQIWLEAGPGLPAGYYTLLPARYALLPGAFLVTPKGAGGAIGVGAVSRQDGASIVQGYRANTLTQARDSLPTVFEVAQLAVTNSRARYDVYSANADLPDFALSRDAAPSRAPIDAGQLVLAATSAMSVRGALRMDTPQGGRGGLVDIGSSSDIVINDTGTGAGEGVLYLSASDLSKLGAESLLIGGVRSSANEGVLVNVTSSEVTLANTEERAFYGAEIILTARELLTLADGSALEQRGSISGAADTLLFGGAATAGSGNGALVRVSSDTGAYISRRGVTLDTGGDLVVGQGASLSGASVNLDSTGYSDFDLSMRLAADTLSLGGGRISLVLGEGSALQTSGGIVLSSDVLGDIQSRADGLSLRSYSTIDFYGAGAIGALDGGGRPSVEAVSFSAAGLRGFTANGEAVTINARNVTFDNTAGGVGAEAVAGVNDIGSGQLVVNAESIEFGEGEFDVIGYALTDISARNGVRFGGTGGFGVAGDLTVASPLTTAATGADHWLAAEGALMILPFAGGESRIESGLGARLALRGDDVNIGSRVYLPSGVLNVEAKNDLTISAGGLLDVTGIATVWQDQIRYTNAGAITLEAEEGVIEIAGGGTINVSAAAQAGNAGALNVRATGRDRGAFIVHGELRGAAENGESGRFSLDARRQGSLGAINTALSEGGFEGGRSFRVRAGDVLVDGADNRASAFVVSADEGQVRVNGRIDASGETGGRIELYGYQGVALESGATLTVAAEERDAAGKGGSVLLEAGGARLIGGSLRAGPGRIDIAAGSLIDLSVDGGEGGALHLRAPQVDASGAPIATQTAMTGTIHAGVDLAIDPIAGEIRNASSIVAEGFQIFDLTSNGTGGGVIDINARNAIRNNGLGFTANTIDIVERLISGNAGLAPVFHLRPGAEVSARTQAPVSVAQAGDTLMIPIGNALRFPSGLGTGNAVSFTQNGVLHRSDGSTRVFAAGENVAIGANDTVTLDRPGELTFDTRASALQVLMIGNEAVDLATNVSLQMNVQATGGRLDLESLGSIVQFAGANRQFVFNAVGDDDLIQFANAATMNFGKATFVYYPGETVPINVARPVVLGEGNSLVALGVSNISASNANGIVVELTNAQTISFYANTTTAVEVGAGDRMSFAAAGASVHSAMPFTVNGVAASIDPASGLYTVQNLAANAAVISVGGGGLIWSVPSNVASGLLTYTAASSSGNRARLALSNAPFTGSFAPTAYQLSAGVRLVAIAASPNVAGNFRLDGANPAYSHAINVGTGGISIPANSRIVAIAPGTQITSSGTGLSVTWLGGGGAPISLAFVSPASTLNKTDYPVNVTGAARAIFQPPPQSITLPDSGTNGAGNWDLAQWRYGPGVNPLIRGSGEPGALTIRSPGDIAVRAAISDGFTRADGAGFGWPYDNLGYYREGTGTVQPAAYPMWQYVLLPAGSESWSYRIVAGADFSAARYSDVTPLDQMAEGYGSVQLGVPSASVDRNTVTNTSQITQAEFQTIRTGTGDISIAAAQDVKLLNQFATIYTAGAQIAASEGASVIVASGGALAIPAGLPVRLPDGKTLTANERVIVTADQDGVITRTVLIGAVDATRQPTLLNNAQLSLKLESQVGALPEGAIITFIAGTEGLPTGAQLVPGSPPRPAAGHILGMPYLLGEKNSISVSAAGGSAGANISFTNGGVIAGLPAGGSVMLENFQTLTTGTTIGTALDTNLSAYLRSTAGGVVTVYGNNASSQPVSTAFAAGELPDVTVPSGSASVTRISIRFNASAELTTTKSGVTSFANLTAGTYRTTSAAGATQVYLPAGSSITTLSANGGIRVDTGLQSAGYIPVSVRQTLQAGVATSFDQNAVLTLNASGSATFSRVSGNAIELSQLGGAGSALHAFDRPNTAYALPVNPILTSQPGAGIQFSRNWFGSLQGYQNTSTGAGSEANGTFAPLYLPQWSEGGGNISIVAGNDIIHQIRNTNGVYSDDSQNQLPINWLYRRSETNGGRFVASDNGDIASTAWWIDYSNFFEGVGALGGGNVMLTAGRDVKNVDAVAPTNAWMPYQTLTIGPDGSVVGVDTLAANQPLFEYGGGDVTVTAGRDVNAGVYYVERGDVSLEAGRDVATNERRSTVFANHLRIYTSPTSSNWLPTQIMLGKGDVSVSAGRDVRLGAVTNPFLLTQGIQNSFYNRAYFLTYDENNNVDISALTGAVTLEGYVGDTSFNLRTGASLSDYFQYVLAFRADSANYATAASYRRSWLRLSQVFETLDRQQFSVATSLMPSNLALTAYNGDVNVIGEINLAPSANGSLSIFADGSFNGYNRAVTASINVSDADPALLPSAWAPLDIYTDGLPRRFLSRTAPSFGALNRLFDESGATRGGDASVFTRQGLHASYILHRDDSDPVRIYASEGDITGLSLYSPKQTQVIAGRDISDIAFYLQNLNEDDVSIVAAGRDIVAYNGQTPARIAVSGTLPTDSAINERQIALPGDIFIGGPGTLEVLAGRNLDLGGKPTLQRWITRNETQGMGLGVISLGNQRNPWLSNGGADIVMAAGLGGLGLDGAALDISTFASAYLNPANLADPELALEDQPGMVAKTYEEELGAWLAESFGFAGTPEEALSYFAALSADQQGAFVWQVYFAELREGGREYNDPDSRRFRSYLRGRQAIAALFTDNADARGDIDLSARRLVRSDQGGDIFMLAPNGGLDVGIVRGGQVNPLDEGLMTLRGGNISIYARETVQVGDSRVFSFRGGDIIVWSNQGDILAGYGSKTLQAAPPARFLIDPATGAAIQDVSGVATGSGIGTLQTRDDAAPASVDLIAPFGVVDAGDAGIRVSGDFNVAALQILNAANIDVQGESSGIPVLAAVDTGALSAASAANAASDASDSLARQLEPTTRVVPSIVSGQFLGFGALDGSDVSEVEFDELQPVN